MVRVLCAEMDPSYCCAGHCERHSRLQHPVCCHNPPPARVRVDDFNNGLDSKAVTTGQYNSHSVPATCTIIRDCGHTLQSFFCASALSSAVKQSVLIDKQSSGHGLTADAKQVGTCITSYASACICYHAVVCHADGRRENVLGLSYPAGP